MAVIRPLCAVFSQDTLVRWDTVRSDHHQEKKWVVQYVRLPRVEECLFSYCPWNREGWSDSYTRNLLKICPPHLPYLSLLPVSVFSGDDDTMYNAYLMWRYTFTSCCPWDGNGIVGWGDSYVLGCFACGLPGSLHVHCTCDQEEETE